MGEQTRGQKWLLICFFGAIVLFFLYFILFVASGENVDSRYSRRPPSDRIVFFSFFLERGVTGSVTPLC